MEMSDDEHEMEDAKQIEPHHCDKCQFTQIALWDVKDKPDKVRNEMGVIKEKLSPTTPLQVIIVVSFQRYAQKETDCQRMEIELECCAAKDTNIEWINSCLKQMSGGWSDVEGVDLVWCPTLLA